MTFPRLPVSWAFFLSAVAVFNGYIYAGSLTYLDTRPLWILAGVLDLAAGLVVVRRYTGDLYPALSGDVLRMLLVLWVLQAPFALILSHTLGALVNRLWTVSTDRQVAEVQLGRHIPGRNKMPGKLELTLRVSGDPAPQHLTFSEHSYTFEPPEWKKQPVPTGRVTLEVARGVLGARWVRSICDTAQPCLVHADLPFFWLSGRP
ncbi:hypothetical protein HNR42_001995 [Deinobacterium chartae]|uniref:Uncharacterized protein n=1 Tax=Deinobacterium chartae TaxID=521158 RepID=A0A841HYE3_9DEIO|nr:hypothetical protein [Deinobacterium chartae]MBB6098561.1 hypothetical protein [Deinobacterium chartae]